LAVILHPPYSPDLTPCDFFVFPNMKFKLKRRRFDTMEEIQAESQKMLDILTENGKKKKNGGDSGTGVYMWEVTTSRVMVADRPYGEFYGFYRVQNILNTPS
jgi:hypothetical protein